MVIAGSLQSVHSQDAQPEKQQTGPSVGVRMGSSLMLMILCPKQQDALQIPPGREAGVVETFSIQVRINSEIGWD